MRNSFESQDRLEIQAERPTLVINNEHGSVNLKPGAPGVVAVTLRKVVFMEDEQQARQLADGIHLHRL